LNAHTDRPPPHSDRASTDAAGAARDRRSARELRDAQLRAALTPLAPHERPPALLAAIAVALLLAVAVAVGTATINDLRRHGGSIPGGIFLSVLLVVLAIGMFGRRYWAVVGFEALLVFQMLVSALALVLAATVYAALGCVLALALGGWLFWKLIRVMGRIQAGQIAGGPNASCDRVAGNG
jgi:hypothetical protein